MKIEKRNLILQAAVDCFTTYGYDKTTMSDIGKRVGMNKASLYYHFKDKLDLFDAMVESKRIIHRDALRNKLEETNPGHDQILLFLCSEIDFVEELAVNFLAITSESKRETEGIFNRIIEEDVRWLVKLIENSPGMEKLKNQTPAELAVSVLKVVRGLIIMDCPIDRPPAERALGYEQVRKEIKTVIGLMLQGAGL